jgi:two-component system CheB/CheR fusion protein
METSYEELKASNEELQSMNEESQSTNEELETSKEELQSINEELATVNSELQSNIDELIRANDDINNLFNSTEIATIFLDKDLNIRNFTPEASALIKIRKSDLGRPLSDIASNIKYEHLNEDIKQVIHRLTHKEIEIQTQDKKWYLLRITPYKTSEDVIDGVVIIFVDINDRMTAEKKVNAALEYSENIINSLKEPILVLNENLTVYSANQSFYDNFKVNPNETKGKSLFSLGKGQWDIPKLRNLLEKILPKSTEFNDYEVEHEFPGIGYKKMILNARRIYRGDVGTQLILLAIEDLTDN